MGSWSKISERNVPMNLIMMERTTNPFPTSNVVRLTGMSEDVPAVMALFRSMKYLGQRRV